jgi:calcineurin-like phosphoesterase family protein
MNPPNKNIFFTSDLHCGHANSIIFDKRPFKDLNHMHEVLINNYNASVSPDAVCYFLGDVGLGKSDEVKKVVSRMNGTKVLILGNHDRNMISMYSQGFDVVLNTATIYIGDKRVSMSHCPLPGVFREDVTGMKGAQQGENWHGEHKNQRFTSQDLTADFHLHGHCHASWHNGKPIRTDRQMDVGVPGNDFRPVSLKQVQQWINSILEKKRGKI